MTPFTASSSTSDGAALFGSRGAGRPGSRAWSCSPRPGRGPSERIGNRAASPRAPPATTSMRTSRCRRPTWALLGAEVVEEGLDLLGLGRHAAPVLDGHVVGHEAAGPRHEAEPDPAEGDGQQDALGLGLAAEGVDDGEADGGGRTGAEGDDRGGGRGDALGRLVVGRARWRGRSRGPPGGDPSGGEDDAAEGEEDGDEPFGHRADAAEAAIRPGVDGSASSWTYRAMSSRSCGSMNESGPNTGIWPGPVRIASPTWTGLDVAQRWGPRCRSSARRRCRLALWQAAQLARKSSPPLARSPRAGSTSGMRGPSPSDPT